MRVYENYKSAELLVLEKVLEVKSVWVKSEIQMELLSRIWNTLDERLQELQVEWFRVLQRKLKEAVREFDELIGEEEVEADMLSILTKKGKLKRGKFALRACNHLEGMIRELESWHRRFDLSWWLTLRVQDGGSRIDEEIDATRECFTPKEGKALATMKNLRTAMHDPPTDMELHHSLREKRITNNLNDSQQTLVSSFPRSGGSIFVSDSFIESQRSDVLHSSCQQAVIEGNQEVIIDLIRPDVRVRPESIIQGIRDLARVLASVDTVTFGLMSCLGVVKVFAGQDGESDPVLFGFDLVFLNPLPCRTPRSLRCILLSDVARVPLNDWFDLARQLARSVFFIHTAKFVHKNIRPETILCFQGGRSSLGKPFLVGFEKFRLDQGATHQFGDDAWERNLYRHPQRQGLHPEESYVMQHDIYSLGVVLLEIGLRTSFVDFRNDQKYSPSESCATSLLEPSVQGSTGDEIETTPCNTFGIKENLIQLAESELPSTMGFKFTQVVISCLTCLDNDNEYFGDIELQDKDGILVGVRYIEKV